MNTLISIVMGIVLNLLGVEVQERQQLAQLQEEVSIAHQHIPCADFSEENCEVYETSSTKNEHKCKLSK